METNVLKELDIFSNSSDPEAIINTAKDTQRSKLQSRQSLLKSFDPLYSSPLKNVMELKPKLCESQQNDENVSSINNDSPLIDITADEVKKEIEQENPQKHYCQTQDIVTVENQLEQNKPLLANTASTSAPTFSGDSEQEEKVDQPKNLNETIPLTNKDEAASTDYIESNIEEQPKQNDCTPDSDNGENNNGELNLNKTIPLAVASTIESQSAQETKPSPSSLVPIEEQPQTSNVVDKEDDELKKMDETVYFSPMKNVTEIKQVPNRQSTVLINLTQAVIPENTKSIIEKIEVKDAFTQYEETNPEVKADALPSTDAKAVEYLQILNQYESQFNVELSGITSLKQEHATLQKHFNTLEMAFSDVHQKYERTKIVLEGYRANEQILKKHLAEAEELVLSYEKTKEVTKKEMIECVANYNKLIMSERKKYQTEINKLIALIKMMEIKVNSTEKSLTQKNTECEDLTRLLNEVTAK